ncbi:Golgin subfamily A member 1 [Pseudolycoriella hygida]|uniref:Golgin subfamily A member 1 n=1 Tax=Pseudolycoriella hygida TaxID=35572 RepID=A0A9Q0N9M7_9DIPT|nr:Golgin subfamily A member 1 [Pseudolycoriella hygida]
MFATLKNKIKEETGNEVPTLPSVRSSQRYQRGALDSTSSISIESLSMFEQKEAELCQLRTQFHDIDSKYNELTKRYSILQDDFERLEKANELLEETVKVSQVQKELIYEEQDKIQNLQAQEIAKLKSLLNFREQEALDRLTVIKQTQQQLDQMRIENKHLRQAEAQREEIEDELEKLRHSSQVEANNYKTSLACLEEENRHLLSKLNVLEEARFNFTSNISNDEKVTALVQERKNLEQRLEEAHIQLSDIKSNWSAQNLALETQVSRLSRQVAAEATEKRKAITTQDAHIEKVKELEFQLETFQSEISQRDNKIKLLEEEIDDLSSTLRDIRIENGEEITFMRSKFKQYEEETSDLKSRLTAADDRLNDYIEKSEILVKSLKSQLGELRDEYNSMSNSVENEKKEKATILLQNAEISQELSILKQELKNEAAEVTELNECNQKLQQSLSECECELIMLRKKSDQFETLATEEKSKNEIIDELNKEMLEKNKSIKLLKQRIADFKKTLQNEFKGSINQTNSCLDDKPREICDLDGKVNSLPEKITSPNPPSNHVTVPSVQNRSVVMDEVNFKYLKHVILKFLTSREVEARHLIRAVGTLLQLNQEEEKLLHDTLSFRMSWFGTRPESKFQNFI